MAAWVAAVSSNARSWKNRVFSAPTQTTSLWKVPPAMAARDCWARTGRPASWRRTMASDASRVWRAGKGPSHGSNASRAQTSRLTPRPPCWAHRRTWFAAPSSARCATAGRASWTANRLASGNMASSARFVCRCSRLRCRLVCRLAGVKCTRPSAASALGVTVAALAAHMGEAEQAAAANDGALRQARSRTWASVPAKPKVRRKGMFGRSCGGRTNWGRPRSARVFILSRP